MKKPIEIVLQYKELLQDLPELIKASGVKDISIIEKLGVSKATFYTRCKNPQTWTLNEIEKVIRFIYRIE